MQAMMTYTSAELITLRPDLIELKQALDKALDSESPSEAQLEHQNLASLMKERRIARFERYERKGLTNYGIAW